MRGNSSTASPTASQALIPLLCLIGVIQDRPGRSGDSLRYPQAIRFCTANTNTQYPHRNPNHCQKKDEEDDHVSRERKQKFNRLYGAHIPGKEAGQKHPRTLPWASHAPRSHFWRGYITVRIKKVSGRHCFHFSQFTKTPISRFICSPPIVYLHRSIPTAR